MAYSGLNDIFTTNNEKFLVTGDMGKRFCNCIIKDCHFLPYNLAHDLHRNYQALFF